MLEDSNPPEGGLKAGDRRGDRPIARSLPGRSRDVHPFCVPSQAPCFRDLLRKITITPDGPVGEADADPCIGDEVGEWGHSVLHGT
jgi:hypothetical protein